MKKWRGSTGAKFGAWVGITVSAVCFIASVAGAAVIWETGMYEYASEEACRAQLYENAASQYAVHALDNMDSGENEQFQDTYFRYGIIKAENIDKLNLNDKDIYVESNFTEKLEPETLYKVSYEIGADTIYSYSGTLFGGASARTSVETSEVPVYQVVYNLDDGIFYYETAEAFYPVHEVGISYPKVSGTGYSIFVYDSEARMYHNELYQEREQNADAAAQSQVSEETLLNVEEYGIDVGLIEEVMQAEYLTFDILPDVSLWQDLWGELILDGAYYRCDGNSIWWVDHWYIEDKGIAKGTNYKAGADGSLYVYQNDAAPIETYWVVVQLPEGVANGWSKDLFVQANMLVEFGYGFRYGIYVILFVSLAFSIFFFVFLINAAGHRRNTDEIVMTWIDRMPFDVYIGFAYLAEAALFLSMIQISYHNIELPGVILFVTLLIAAGWVLLLSLLTFAVRVKRGKWWQNTVIWWVVHGICHVVWTILSNIALLWKALLVIGVLSLVEFRIVAWDGVGRITGFWLLEKIILVPLVLIAIVQMQKLKSGAERMAEGDLEHRIDTEKMFWEFRWHGENLNSISTGMSRAVDERMKSERFKTELITNVSHDIKTPLTSIINYVDLLEKEELQNEKAAEYLEVLERQSARLKKLIEDLMEASKASTGNLAVHLEQLEAGVSVVQIVGEFEEKLQANELKLLIDKPEETVYIQADSRHFWRVADNLMNNICKYAQPGTRVYVNLEKEEKEAVLTFRNTSKFPLNISSEELMERFVRGDSSRNTEGSGLGLSIAKSLMELMGGTFSLYVDGDLFKVILRFPLSHQTGEAVPESAEIT